MKEATCLWAPPFLNPHPVLSTSPPPRHLAASLDSQSHLSQHETHILSHRKGRLTKSELNPRSVYILKIFTEWLGKDTGNGQNSLVGVSHKASQNDPGGLSERPHTSTATVLIEHRDPVLFNIRAQWQAGLWCSVDRKQIRVE